MCLRVCEFICTSTLHQCFSITSIQRLGSGYAYIKCLLKLHMRKNPLHSISQPNFPQNSIIQQWAYIVCVCVCASSESLRAIL